MNKEIERQDIIEIVHDYEFITINHDKKLIFMLKLIKCTITFANQLKNQLKSF